MTGKWAYFEKLDNWHEVVDERIDWRAEDDPVVTLVTWCGLELDDGVPTKDASAISQWADAVHDECFRHNTAG
jgi:hypothetical protein